MPREKFNLIRDLQKKDKELVGKKKLSLSGQGDFGGFNNTMRLNMNNKHHSQHLTIDNPEFPFFYDGKENVVGAHSSFYTKTKKKYVVYAIVKKYEELLKGRCNNALYFLYCREDDSYTVVERKSVENLTENFGFDYNNEFIDLAQVGDVIPEDTVLTSSTSYDPYGNTSIGVNGRIMYGVHPAVQDDAIVCSKSFAQRMVANNVKSITIPVGRETILLNLYGKNGAYQPLPDIGTVIEKEDVIVASRIMKENRMFSEFRDSSLMTVNAEADQRYFGEGEIIDINVYCNNPDIRRDRSNAQIIQYWNDAKWFYTDIYKVCRKILRSGSKKIDREINRWMRKAMNYLDSQAVWSFNDNVFQNFMVEILIRKKEPIKIGRKIVGRAGNKTVVCKILPDDEMPYLATETYKDEYGVIHPRGPLERVDLITNPLAIINRTIPSVLFEGSVTFIMDRVRKHAATMDSYEDAKELMFDVLRILNPKQTKDLEDIYNGLSEKKKKEFIRDMISIDGDGLLMTNNGMYLRFEAFGEGVILRDAIIEVYDKYADILQPYDVFMPKPKWGRDIYIGKAHIGYQYIMMLKQSGEKGFSVRAAGAISDESLPEKSNANKLAKAPWSSKPIRFGEYETPNFMIITDPADFALITALYRSSIDGRRYMYEAILDDTEEGYHIPDNFTSRTAEILKVYLKSLGVRMEVIDDEDEFIGEPNHETELITYRVGNISIFCTSDEMYYLRKLKKTYHKYIKKHPNEIDDTDEVWDWILDHLPFKKKHLTSKIVDLFRSNMEAFAILEESK